MITKEKKQKLISDFKTNPKDTGSAQVQVAVATARITELTEHFKTHPNDFAGKRGLIKLVNNRKKLLEYLKKTDSRAYEDTIKRLGLRK
ncbi:MAG: 30S ribosomal protein S15 [Rickettsiales bacterium]|jgi:small subunit ribosomal protein S15|nr:30S ribosomal protein S15 [Rickettsiales bacterium]